MRQFILSFQTVSNLMGFYHLCVVEILPWPLGGVQLYPSKLYSVQLEQLERSAFLKL